MSAHDDRPVAHAPPGARPRTATSISIARVICIVGLVYAHAWTGLGGDELAAADPTAQGTLRWILMELFGRSAVPLLGMISGWLAVGSAGRRSYAGFVASRAQTVLAPMVAWNALALVLVSGAASIGLIGAPVPQSWSEFFDELFCLAAPNDINVQMPFLRDLFVCMVAAPFLGRAPRWLLISILVAALAWTLSGWAFPLLLRPSILLFFVAGMVVRREGLEGRIAALPAAVFAVPFVALAILGAWIGASGLDRGALSPVVTAGLELLLRIVAAGFFWALAWRIAARPIAALFLKAEPFAFLMFCAHVIMIWLAGPLIGRMTGPLGSPLYPLYLFAQPALVLIATLALGRILVRAMPRAARLLSGGRLEAQPRVAGARA